MNFHQVQARLEISCVAEAESAGQYSSSCCARESQQVIDERSMKDCKTSLWKFWDRPTQA